ncbi:hypothetical protein IFM89_016153 [Coptis chinensis]|uniref:Uncharacterized protein n=1 Tax=Coptis chinensis TaxID=261450 RepID=A0A835HDM0_9MAGN|nr:hypothetical protein IFM89_016153 [Coptis chinensis]
MAKQIEANLSEDKDLLPHAKLQIKQDLKLFGQPIREKLLQFEQELKDRHVFAVWTSIFLGELFTRIFDIFLVATLEALDIVRLCKDDQESTFAMFASLYG